MKPYDPPLITLLLKSMTPERLASVHHYDFQRAPLDYVTPGSLIRELIANEKARRNRNG